MYIFYAFKQFHQYKYFLFQDVCKHRTSTSHETISTYAFVYFCVIILELTKDDSHNFSIGLEDDDLFKWRVFFEGPPDTLYEGGLFNAILSFPQDFPNTPPKMKFESEMWHPNSLLMYLYTNFSLS